MRPSAAPTRRSWPVPDYAIVFRYFTLFATAFAMTVAQRLSSTISHSGNVEAFEIAGMSINPSPIARTPSQNRLVQTDPKSSRLW